MAMGFGNLAFLPCRFLQRLELESESCQFANGQLLKLLKLAGLLKVQPSVSFEGVSRQPPASAVISSSGNNCIVNSGHCSHCSAMVVTSH